MLNPQYFNFEKPEGHEDSTPTSFSIIKPNELAIGAGSESLPILTGANLFTARVNNIEQYPWLFFYGFIDYLDIENDRFRSGYCFLLNRELLDKDIGFHVAWGQNPERYNFHRKLAPIK
ncbi:MAG: hypothetical protein Q8M91_13295 [Polaromonas sp.]|nr:hypothetical protein [Polaromonas sp.]